MAWSSSDTSVATVSARGLVTAVGRGSTRITATSGGVNGRASITVTLPATRIAITPSRATLISVGDTEQLTATVYDANDDIIPSATVAWSSSDTSVATVSARGLVTAVGRGSTRITATSGGVNGRASITVTLPASRIEVEPSSAKLTSVGATEQLTATVYDANDDIIPGATVAWSSSDSTVATVSARGQVTAVSGGSTMITATSGSVNGRASITVTLPASRIEVEPSSAKLTSVGATEQLTATVYDANNDVIGGASVAWTSSDTSVATVDTDGLVTAESSGSTTITATSGGKSGRASITVALPASRIAITPPSATLTSVGATRQLTATVYDANNDAISGASVSWTSGDSTVATVTMNGLVTAVRRGSARITATSGGVNGSASITVALPASRIEIDPPSATLTSVGATRQLTATVYDANNDAISGASVSWTSGDSTVATVTMNGLVTAVRRGSARITATSGGVNGSASITVALPASRIEIDPPSATLTSVGATRQLSATVYDTNGEEISGATLAWTSSDTSVATVDTDGLVTAVRRGSARITATSGGVNGSASITVALPASRIEIAPPSATSTTLKAVGATVQLIATVYDENNDIIAGAMVAWTSGDSTVAKVDTDGLVTAVANGSANITARADTISASIQVTVMTTSPDRSVLVDLYNATDGDNWRNNTNWLSDEPIGTWYGVTTNTDGRVTGLGLQSNTLKGSLPSTLGNLSELTRLDLHRNRKSPFITPGLPPENGLKGSPPASLGNLSKLKFLDLSQNGFTSFPSSLGNLSSLTHLYIYDNEITSLPSSLGNLSSLTHLSAFELNLSGSIPSWVGSLSSMQQLLLNENGFTGRIPSSLGNLSNLTVLWLDDNSLTGIIPPSLTNLSRLVSLLLSGNNLTGCIPPALHDIRSNDLEGLDLDDCEE